MTNPAESTLNTAQGTPTSAELLREASALMRERAEAATGSPWIAFHARATNPLDYAPVIGVTRDLTVDYDTDLFATQKCRAEDAEHIASWHPAVALAVARWLDDESYAPEADLGDGITTGGPRMEAIAVARAYLGRQS